MPDHVHGIIVINASEIGQGFVFVETQHAASLQHASLPLPKSGSISAIVRSYKSAVTHRAGENGYTEFSWQARFYDRIICDEASLANVRFYIVENPHKGAMDDGYPPNIEV